MQHMIAKTEIEFRLPENAKASGQQLLRKALERALLDLRDQGATDAHFSLREECAA